MPSPKVRPNEQKARLCGVDLLALPTIKPALKRWSGSRAAIPGRVTRDFYNDPQRPSTFVRVADNPPKRCVALPRTPFGADLIGDYTPGWIGSCRRATGFTPVNSLKHIRKLVEHSALVVPDNLLFHKLPTWSDKGGRKL